MGRHHSDDEVFDAARAVVLQQGARAARFDTIGTASGAAASTLYRRFSSLEELLGEMWIRAARRSQEPFLNAMNEPAAIDAASAAALALHDFALRQPDDARLLASLRREDLVGSAPPRGLVPQLDGLDRQLREAFVELAQRLFGRADRATIEATVSSVADLAEGAIRRYLISGDVLPPALRASVEARVRVALVQAGARGADPVSNPRGD